MAYYSNPKHSFNRGDKVVVVNYGNPALEVASGKMVVPLSVASDRGVIVNGRPIEEVVDEDGNLR